MKRTMLISAAMCGSIWLALAVPATAGASGGVDATMASVSCSNVTGNVTFTPPLKNKAMASETVKFTETVTGCATTAAAPISKGTVTAKITTDPAADGFSSACDLIGDSSEFGTQAKGTVAWTSSPRLSSGDTTFTVAPMHWSSQGTKQKNLVGWSFGTPLGSFQGSNHGAFDAAWADSTITVFKAAAACNSSSGLSSLALRTTLAGDPPVLSLGGTNPD
jgi:hypothetical protein